MIPHGIMLCDVASYRVTGEGPRCVCGAVSRIQVRGDARPGMVTRPPRTQSSAAAGRPKNETCKCPALSCPITSYLVSSPHISSLLFLFLPVSSHFFSPLLFLPYLFSSYLLSSYLFLSLSRYLGRQVVDCCPSMKWCAFEQCDQVTISPILSHFILYWTSSASYLILVCAFYT